MSTCFFASDLHGKRARYQKLFAAIERERPRGVFLGGDLLPNLGLDPGAPEAEGPDFIHDFLAPNFRRLANDLGSSRPDVFLILGNDDPRSEEEGVREGAAEGIWHYVHWERRPFEGLEVIGYSFVPPTPFLLKDWERYDVSRYVDPGCVSPEEGFHTAPVSEREARFSTIQEDLEVLAGDQDLGNAIFLFHAPPYDTPLDRAGLDGTMVDHVPVDVHVGSIAIRRFIEAREPRVTLHGHIHESARITGAWRCRIGRTHALNAAHDGEELALVRFDPDRPGEAARSLI
ncbi:MAG: metallophosphoesterase family protein [Bacteroidota bacterium]